MLLCCACVDLGDKNSYSLNNECIFKRKSYKLQPKRCQTGEKKRRKQKKKILTNKIHEEKKRAHNRALMNIFCFDIRNFFFIFNPECEL